MKQETGFWNSKSPDGGLFFAALVVFFLCYTMCNSEKLTHKADNTYIKK